MVKCKITVLKRTVNPELEAEYCADKVGPCPRMKEGMVFIAGTERPDKFCSWAWNDIHKSVMVLLSGGSYSKGAFTGWMKHEGTIIACCTDGVRPVIFKLERIED